MSLQGAMGVLTSGPPVVVGILAITDGRSDVVVEDADERCDVAGWGWGHASG